jgi:GT2 family glycosyltransferase
MNSTPAISVVIPTYNHRDGLSRILDALETQTLPRHLFEVIFVDDRSTDGTAEVLESAKLERHLDMTVLSTSSNSRGPARPRNIGWHAARAPVVAFLDDDCVPDPSWLAAGLAEMQARPRMGVMQGKTLTPASVDLHALDRYAVYRLILGPSPWFEAVNILYRRAALEEAGGFNESLATWGEDTDLGWKVVAAGWERGFCAGATAVHDVERRGWRWWVTFGLKEANIVLLAARHPQFREEAFWRPWAVRRDGAAFAGALLGLAAAPLWRPFLAATLPYLWLRRPKVRRGRIVQQAVEILLADAARFAGVVKGSIIARTLVL